MGRVTDKKILVTGGGGFLGGALVRLLLEKGYKVRSFSRGFYPELADLDVEQVQGNLNDAEAVSRACRDIELVFHTAALPGVWGDYSAYYRTNVTGTQNIIDACIRHNITRMVYTSSPSVVFDGSDMEGVNESVPYPDSFHAHYPKTKALAERAVIRAAKKGLQTISLRPHLIWGPGDNHLAPRILDRADKLRVIGNGGNRVDTIYIDNAAHAHLLAAEKLAEKPELSGRVYFISQDDPIPLWDMVNAILKAGGKPPVTRRISPNTALFAGTILETFYSIFRLKSEPRITRFVAREMATAHWFDISAAKKDLDFRPLVSTDEGLKRLEEWLCGR